MLQDHHGGDLVDHGTGAACAASGAVQSALGGHRRQSLVDEPDRGGWHRLGQPSGEATCVLGRGRLCPGERQRQSDNNRLSIVLGREVNDPGDVRRIPFVT